MTFANIMYNQCYITQYLDLSEASFVPTGSNKAWMYLGLAMKLAHSVRLPFSVIMHVN